MKEWNKCPNCGFEGLMNSWGAMGHSGKNYVCPECNHQFGNLERVIGKKNS